MKVTLKKLTCQHCGHTWTPRKDDVRQCPKCRSLYWDVPKAKVKKTIETILSKGDKGA